VKLVTKVVVKERVTDYDNEEYVYYVNDKEIFSFGDPEYYSDGDDILASIMRLLAELNIEVEVT